MLPEDRRPYREALLRAKVTAGVELRKVALLVLLRHGTELRLNLGLPPAVEPALQAYAQLCTPF